MMSMRSTDRSSTALSFCLVLDNPFFKPSARVVPEESLLLPGVKLQQVAAYLEDDDLLASEQSNPLKGLGGGSSAHASTDAPIPLTTIKAKRPIPTNLQKVVDMILRLTAKGFELDPPDMLAPVPMAPPANAAATATSQPGGSAHSFAGWCLIEDNLFVSKDKDEMYIRISGKDEALLQYAQEQGIYLNTHPLSFSGGAPMAYSTSLDMQLKDSVETFLTVYPEEDASSRDAIPRGFIFEYPDRSRVTVRMIREGWRFGGCGLQIAEMRKRRVLVRNFFPLHNPKHSTLLRLDEWGSLRKMFTMDPLYQVEDNVVEYFGEEVALYFAWILAFTRALMTIAAIGGVCGIIGAICIAADALDAKDTIYGLFSVVCVLWGVGWNIKWLRKEQTFALMHGQDSQMSQELVRDEFEPTGEQSIAPTDIFNMQFDVPLTLKRLSDGTLVNLTSDRVRRLIIRYLVAYPVIICITAAMLTVMVLLTYWRFDNPDSNVVSYASSALSIATSAFFGFFFDFVAAKFNAMENNRTESEESSQTISKNFFFNFFSKYFTLFTIMLWPANVGSVSVLDAERLDQIEVQMLTLCVLKPMIQNIQEILMPVLMTQFRVRRDIHDSAVQGVLSLLRREHVDMERSLHESSVPREQRARSLWLEAQMEPYESTRGDYLEITLQFGYMTMFAATFPWAAVAALVYNIMEVRVDAWKLLNFHQRPLARPANSIGAWNTISFFIVSAGLATNGYLVAIMSRFRYAVNLNTNDDSEKYQTFLVVQYIWLTCIFGIFALVSRSSTKVLQVRAKRALLANYATRKRLETTLDGMARKKTGTSVITRSEANQQMFDRNTV